MICLYTTGKVIKLYDHGFLPTAFDACCGLIDRKVHVSKPRLKGATSLLTLRRHIYHSPIHGFQYIMNLLRKVAASTNRDGTTTRENWHDCLLDIAS
jgi:hypothetical protein